MTYQDPNPVEVVPIPLGSDTARSNDTHPRRGGIGTAITFVLAVLLIVGFTILGISSNERSATNPPAQTTGESTR
jgi:hypothetical protein